HSRRCQRGLGIAGSGRRRRSTACSSARPLCPASKIRSDVRASRVLTNRMAELPLYWSAEQTREYVAALNQDPAFQKAARKFDDSVVFRCLDTPGGTDIEVTYRIKNGQVSEERREEPAPSRAIRDAPFDKKKAFARTTAPYAIWTKLDR